MKGVKTDVCIAMSNHAAELTTFLIETRICDFSGSYLGKVKRNRLVKLYMRHGYSNMLATITDAYEYAKRIEGHTPHKAKVLVGKWATKLSSGGRSWAPCFDFWNSQLAGDGLVADGIVVAVDGVLAHFGLPPVSSLGLWAAEFITGVDIVMHNNDKHSRGVAVHEYGHFLTCSLMTSADKDLFSNFNADVIHQTANGQDPSDVQTINEGFADFFTKQIIGGMNYFNGPAGSGFRGDGVFYCDPRNTLCDDDNIGGTPGTEMKTSYTLSDPDDKFDYKTGLVATYLQDVADGHAGNAEQPGNGAAFKFDAPLFSHQANAGHDSDEKVALGKGWIRKVIKKLAARRDAFGPNWRATHADLFSAVNDVVLAETGDKRKMCNLCEAHLNGKYCEEAFWTKQICKPNELKVTVTGAGKVKAAASPVPVLGKVDCVAGGSTCAASYEKTDSVVITATPNAGQVFVGWSGGGCTGTAATCTVNMSASRNVTAKFEPSVQKIKLTIKSNGGAGGAKGMIFGSGTSIACQAPLSTGTCTAMVPVNSTVVLTGTKNESHGLDWTDSKCNSSDDFEYKCTLKLGTTDYTAVGNFWYLL